MKAQRLWINAQNASNRFLRCADGGMKLDELPGRWGWLVLMTWH